MCEVDFEQVAQPSASDVIFECKLQQYLKDALKSYMKALKEKSCYCHRRFTKAFPEIHTENLEALLLISDAFGQKFSDLLDTSVSELAASSDAMKRLEGVQELDEVKELWRPSGEPKRDVSGHLSLLYQNDIAGYIQGTAVGGEEIEDLKKMLVKKERLFNKDVQHINSEITEIAAMADMTSIGNMYGLRELTIRDVAVKSVLDDL